MQYYFYLPLRTFNGVLTSTIVCSVAHLLSVLRTFT